MINTFNGQSHPYCFYLYGKIHQIQRLNNSDCKTSEFQKADFLLVFSNGKKDITLCINNIGRVVRKPVFGVFQPDRPKSACQATETKIGPVKQKILA